MRAARWLILLIFLLLPLSLQAQDNDDSDAAYAEALRRIEKAQQSDAVELSLSRLVIISIPHEFAQLPNMRYETNDFIFPHSGMTKLPSKLWQLTHLESLDISHNKLDELPPEIRYLTQLEELNLVYNNLEALPPDIGQLANLTTLVLEDNRIATLPSEIGQLSRLRELSLFRNRLNYLPKEVGQLVSLERLDISNNHLDSLPPEIGQLENLCYLNVRSNQFRHLPPELGNILVPSEKCPNPTLVLYNNPLITPPPEVVEQGTSAILAYLREQAWYHTRQLIMNMSGGVGFFAVVVLGLRWRYRRVRKPKAKRGDVAH